jgi:murein DD-endopeptidase MepM/ murein hydrolase activator NlpD
MIAIHLVVLYFVGDLLLQRIVTVQPTDKRSVADPTSSTPVPTPLSVPETFADLPEPNANVADVSETAPISGLIIPVVGVKPEQLLDTFSESRSEGRYHDAIDIAAPAGTPVIAATDGEIVKFFDSQRGGITIYQLTDDKKFLLYYAHLQRRADEISVGMRVRKGATIGYVGDTGNAGAGNYHLHFAISIVTDPKRFSGGTQINAYPLLKSGTYPQPQTSP